MMSRVCLIAALIVVTFGGVQAQEVDHGRQGLRIAPVGSALNATWWTRYRAVRQMPLHLGSHGGRAYVPIPERSTSPRVIPVP